MKHLFATAVLVNALALTFFPGTAFATPHRQTAPVTYQVKGPVLELTADMIVVKKGNVRWEIARNASTRVTGDLKVSATVTIQYRMIADGGPGDTSKVTGQLLELTSDLIAVKKGNFRWEIGRTASSKVTGNLKVGATVTIAYEMIAASIDVKQGKKP